MSFSPPLTALGDLPAQMTRAGFAVLSAESTRQLCQVPAAELDRWLCHWDALPPDRHLKDGGRYRRRRHGSFIVSDGRMRQAPHRAHWQPLEYNALHGGIERWFEPLPESWVAAPGWASMLCGLAGLAATLWNDSTFYVEAHPFRIDTTDGIGRPTPEGAHRDGVDMVAVLLVSRLNIKGGETRVFDAAGPNGMRFTLSEPWSMLLLDDARMIHESTPIQPLDPAATAHRDTLVITLRRQGFQGPG